MNQRRKATVLDSVANGLGPPCLVAAFALEGLVSWVPGHELERWLLCGSFAATGLGAIMVVVRIDVRGLRVAGGITMVVGLCGLLLAFWL